MKLWCGERSRLLKGKFFLLILKRNPFLSNGLIGQEHGVSDIETEMQTSGKLRIVVVSGDVSQVKKAAVLWKWEMVSEFVRLTLQLGGWVCRQRYVQNVFDQFPHLGLKKGAQKNMLKIGLKIWAKLWGINLSLNVEFREFLCWKSFVKDNCDLFWTFQHMKST